MLYKEITTANNASLSSAMALDKVLELNATLIHMETTPFHNVFRTEFTYRT